ncbi:adenylate/guanylate cyclase domain-containing protein [Cupriavidus sp. P-10]|nr:adenylate/guanylate cyclase domain-containing protein [Cupriavidus sp. P-10]
MPADSLHRRADPGSPARFCRSCGRPFAAGTPHVGIGLWSAAGTDLAPALYTPLHLAERIRAQQAATGGGDNMTGERKTITALFSDMAASTALIQDLDPEDARGLIDPVVALMMEAVHHYEGYVAKSLGDGILALFGAPIAHEDHPHRAIYAALRMQEAMRRHSDKIRAKQGIPLQIRVGVHTGEVVVRPICRDDLRADYDPVGHTIHIASRMEGVAAPSTILVSETTKKLAEGYFEFKSLGTIQVKGVRNPLTVYEVMGLGALRTRLQVSAYRGLVRFVGRQLEMDSLHDAWDKTRAGHGQIVGVSGEAGVGKSRLFHEFKARFQQGCMVLETYSVSHGKAFPYLPLFDLLRNYFDLTGLDDDRLSRERVTGRLLALDRDLEEYLPYLLYLLGTSEAGSALPGMDPGIRRQRTLKAIVELFLRESVKQPLLVLFEDLQWLDRETEAFLNMLMAHVPHARILLLLNYRPEYVPSWGSTTRYAQIDLKPLGGGEAQGMLAALLGSQPSLAPLKALIMSKTDGNPLFIEEVVKTLAEEHVLLGAPGHYWVDKPPLTLHIPTSVQGVLSARMDRLPHAQKELLQTLAVIGTEFPFSLVQHVTALSEAVLRSLLHDLQEGDFIHERPSFPEVDYAFKHALTQEVAGQALLSTRRSALHERTAEAIEALFPGRLKEYCNELAHHYSKSGKVAKAVEYLHLAARQALQRSAHVQAIQHLQDALALLKSAPDASQRSRAELSLLLSLGQAWMAVRGQASVEVESAYRRAAALCQQGEKTQEFFSAQLGLWSFHQLRAQYGTARSLAVRLFRIAKATKNSEQLTEAHRALGSTLFRLGDIKAARIHMEHALTQQRSDQQDYDQLMRYMRNPAVHTRSALSWILWYLGMPDQSRACSQDALALARKGSDPFSLALGLAFAAQLYQCRREAYRTMEYAEAAVSVSSEQGYPHYLAWGTVLRGWALSAQGAVDEGLVQIRQGLSAHQATGAALGRPTLLALLAETYANAGQVQAGLDVLTEAIDLVAETCERFSEPTLLRLKGDLLLRLPSQGRSAHVTEKDAESHLVRAIALARQQASRSVELQAALSLAALWQRQDKRHAAHEMLAAVHGAFTEGYDTVDWRHGDALLKELS